MAVENFLDWKRQSESFESMALYRRRSFGLGRNETDPIVVIQTATSSSEFFEVLGVQPQLGRSFTAEEELRDEKVILLGHELWSELFEADPALVGQTVLLK